eukprot:scaffold357_cov400-Prasinococcus_capsulatus_cf.AAC.1
MVLSLECAGGCRPVWFTGLDALPSNGYPSLPQRFVGGAKKLGFVDRLASTILSVSPARRRSSRNPCGVWLEVLCGESLAGTCVGALVCACTHVRSFACDAGYTFARPCLHSAPAVPGAARGVPASFSSQRPRTPQRTISHSRRAALYMCRCARAWLHARKLVRDTEYLCARLWLHSMPAVYGLTFARDTG